jgi:chitin disaccharide deacetylase
LPKSRVSSLVSDDGDFPASTFEVARSAKLSDVESELRAQIHKAINAGIEISHLDHHMWVLYARPDFLRLYVQLGKDFGIPIRFSRQVSRQRMDNYGEEAFSVYLDQLKELELAGLPILDDIEADNYSIPAADKRTYYLTNFRNLRPGLTEIVIHCASPDGSHIEPPDAAARYADTAIFSAHELRDDLSSMRIEIVNWKQFRAKKPFQY